ncbi:MAG TPA: D-xylose transporter XylE [Balneola sp.]|jgi:MFS transporter, SP family, xylose:H+ symportor|nr:D-xylose transporter XylE [Balneola sp.]MAO76729.1 D-xylose transporter XylE [Balneola sp.]MBF65136.1 D-xylose transporter XylE [Balneola sp.]HAH51398.1 D-xylose transporter XylE [Balneola sp.]HAW79533.1 D-xylose transporter XylE [Balneola sp.]|tara:strand:- start:468 stop:1853 length:1386 start_codon:yes stop_codon:yes gene_type:complete
MNNRLLILATVVASLGGLLFGYDTGVINGSQFYFSKFFELSTFMKGWAVSSALVGCFLGAIIAGFLSNYLGRKTTLILSAVLFTLSAWGSGLPSFFPQSIEILIFFRVLGGLGIGIASMTAPMYIAEISPAASRGKMVTYYQVAIVTGFFVVFLATYFIGSSMTEIENLEYGWRYMFWSELIPCILFLGLLFFVPRSPRWLVIKNRTNEALDILRSIHGEELAKKEYEEIKLSIVNDNKKELKSILSKSVLPVIIIGSVLSILQQTTGINAVLYYGADIFEKALGFGQEDILKQQILLAGINFICTFIAMYSVDKLGRKPLIIYGSLGMLAGFLLLGITLMNNQVGLLSLIGILIFIGSFSLSMGPVTWVLLSEIFPNSVRSKALSIAVAAQWAANYAVSQSFPVVAESTVNTEGFWNNSLPYFIFSGFIILLIIFTLKFIPETKGKSLEELEEIWENKYA